MKNQQTSTSLVPDGYWGTVPPAKRPLGNAPLLQWHNALNAGNKLSTGWSIQASRCSEELNSALRTLGVERLTVLHRMSGELVEYWSLGACRMYVLCNGFSDPWEMRQSEDREGLAYGWIAEKQHSKLKVRVLIAELAEVGYYEPFVITLEGLITNEFFEALQHQFDVLDAFELISSGQSAPYWGFALELAPAEKPKMVGSRGKQSPIVPMVAQVPTAADISEAYLAEHVMGPELLAVVRDRDLVGKAITWSVDVSRHISAGADREEWETDAYEAALHSDFLGEGQEEPLAVEMMTKQQEASIRNLYQALGKPDMELPTMSMDEAKSLIGQLLAELKAKKASASAQKRSSNGK